MEDKTMDGRCGFLIYAHESETQSIIQKAQQFGITEWKVNSEDLNMMKQVGKTCLIVQHQRTDLMRGMDYKSSIPLHLLVAHPLPNQRAYDQALGRVERFGCKGSRSILKGVQQVDAKM